MLSTLRPLRLRITIAATIMAIASLVVAGLVPATARAEDSVVEALDIGFTGSLVGTTAYTTTEGEVMHGMVHRVEGGEEQTPGGGVALAGGTQGIQFEASGLSIGDADAGNSFLGEIAFTPTAAQSGQSTIFSAGGNFYVRSNINTGQLEYGFDSNAGSWESHKQQVSYPELNKEHVFSFHYLATADGVTLYASLNGEELPPVTSDEPGRNSDGLGSTFGIGNEVNPGGLDRGFVGTVHQVRVASAPDSYSPANYELQPQPASTDVLDIAYEGTVDGGAYIPADGETSLGALTGRTGAETFNPGKVILAGGTQSVDFAPSDVSLGETTLDRAFVVETAFTPDATQSNLATLLSVGGNLFVRYGSGSLEYGFSSQSDTGWTEFKKSTAAPTDNEQHVLSVAYVPDANGGATMTVWLDGRALPDVVGTGLSTRSADAAAMLAFGNEVNPQALTRGYAGSIEKSRFATLTNGFIPAAFELQERSTQECEPLELDPANYITVTPADCNENIIAKSTLVRPTRAQMDWQEARRTAFIHFGINTFYDQEWGHGTEDPARFTPTDLDPESWVKTLRDNGFRYAILTVKHHDGFMLYPSRYTDYDIASTPWKDGNGDIVKEFTDAARKYGMKVGLYMSPADSHEELEGGVFGNGSPKSTRTIPTLVEGDDRAGKDLPTFEYEATDYGAHFLNTLYEILTQYGQIDEVWFDGAQGNTAKQELYDYPAFYDLIEKLQPQAVVAVGGRDVRWVGNETGDARLNEWGPMAIDNPANGGKISMADGASFQDTGSREALINGVRSGRANALHWWPTEADMKLTGGWFAHPNDVPRTPENLMHHYDMTTGRNSLMLLNVPPTTTGKFAPESVAALEGFTDERRMAFAEDQALGLPVLANGTPETSITDGNGYTSWSSEEVGTTTFELNLGSTRPVDRVSLGEDVFNHGQAVEEFTVEAFVDGAWEEVAAAGTIGYNRSLTFPSVKASKVRVTIEKMRGPVHLATMSVYAKAATPPPMPTDIYVDCSASVAGPGTKDRPFTTLEQFRQTEIAPGTTIHFRSGTTCAESSTSYWGYGTTEAPITVTTYDGDVEPLIGAKPASEVFSELKVQGWKIDFNSDSDPEDPPADEKSVSLSANTLWIGDALTVTARGYKDGEEVTFSARNDLSGTVTADSTGTAVFEWPVTAQTKPGVRNLIVTDEDGDSLRTKFMVKRK